MNKWNTLKVATYGACLGLLYAASLEIGLWAHPDVNDQLFGTQGGPVNVIVFALDGRIMAYQEKMAQRTGVTEGAFMAEPPSQRCGTNSRTTHLVIP
jgi:hypothetical protein